MPRQETICHLPQKAVLASFFLHVGIFSLVFLFGAGGEAGVAGTASGGIEAIQVGLVSSVSPSGVSAEIGARAVSASKSSKLPESAEGPPKADAVPSVRTRRNTTAKKQAGHAKGSPQRFAPAGNPASVQTQADSGGTGSGGKAAAAAGGPGAATGDGKPFGFSLAEVSNKPAVVKRVPVNYPREARQKRVTGFVLVRFHLDEAGTVSHLSIKSAAPPGIFNENTLAAVRQWRFSPAKREGRAVPVWVELPIEFDLRR